MTYFRVIIKFTTNVYPFDSETCARHSIVASKHGGVWILSSLYVHQLKEKNQLEKKLLDIYKVLSNES